MSAARIPCDLRSCSWFVAICLAWTLNGRAAPAQAVDQTFDLRIAEQPLDEALQEFSRQSGMQVIFFSSITAGIQSPGVKGKHTVASALEELLAGSDLTFRVINARTVEIRKRDLART